MSKKEVNWFDSIWDLLANGHTVEEIIEALPDLTEELIRDVKGEMEEVDGLEIC